MDNLCEKCRYNVYDAQEDDCFCDLDIDEDDYVRLLADSGKSCRYFCPDGGEYEIVRRQN